MTPADLPIERVYEALKARFRNVQTDTRGGVTFNYATGEQVITRLNEVLGPDGWSFKVVEHGVWVEADEVWVLGEMTATFGGSTTTTTVTRQQFGSQKVKRSRSSGTPLDIGFDLKGATTDALKKCATLLGVALYLSEKEVKALNDAHAGNATGDRAGNARETRQDARPASQPAPAQSGTAGRSETRGRATETRTTGPAKIACKRCEKPLEAVSFDNGERWTAAELANNAIKLCRVPLCIDCYRDEYGRQQQHARATAG